MYEFLLLNNGKMAAPICMKFNIQVDDDLRNSILFILKQYVVPARFTKNFYNSTDFETQLVF